MPLQTKQVNLADLQPYPGNPRTHDIPLIQESLRTHGQFRAIVVRKDKRPDRNMTILAGHGTVAAAREEGWDKITAHLIEVDDEQARQIVLMDNRANDRGGYDENALVALLKEAPDLKGTGFEKSDLDRLTARMIPPSSEPQSIPQTFEILIAVDDKDTQDELLLRLTQEGLKCRALL
jgi:ParB-like chromosome segregation protein Spo0J